MKAAFCDRDGTITEEYSDDFWPQISEPVFRPGSIEGLKWLSANGYTIFIITNQPLIGAGKLTRNQYDDYTNRLVTIARASGITFRDIFMCPHLRSEGCRCCKPEPGMIEQAVERHGPIDFTRSILIGDRVSDMELARSFGMRGFSVGFDAPPATRVETILDATRSLK